MDRSGTKIKYQENFNMLHYWKVILFVLEKNILIFFFYKNMFFWGGVENINGVLLCLTEGLVVQGHCTPVQRSLYYVLLLQNDVDGCDSILVSKHMPPP